MIELVLVLISLIWLTYSSYEDLRIHEVPDWISYSLIIMALAFYSIKSVVLKDFTFILQSLFGLLLFYLLGCLMYYTRQWGGGDVKILTSLGALFPVYPKELINYFNPNLDAPFIIIMLLNIIIFGALYSLFYSLYLIIKNKVKIKFKVNKFYLSLSIMMTLIGIFLQDFILKILLMFLALIILIFPHVKILVHLIDQKIMIKRIQINKLTEGDWVIEDIYSKGKLIYNKKNLGISAHEIKLLKKLNIKQVLIREGLPFIPSFLIAFIASLIFGNILGF